MDERKVDELISYLAPMQFKGNRLESDIRRNIREGMPYFSVRHKIDYGRERMFFDLRFRKDHQFGAYRLEGYKATHRNPVDIDHQVINGINTADLEERMGKVDWDAHFNQTDEYLTSLKDTGVARIISDLLELDANRNIEGIKIQELLQFKYFPERQYDERLKELQSQYDNSREFTATENGLCNANLAYNILSGKLDDLYEKLQPLGLDQYPGMDVYHQLETIFSGNPDAFELKCLRNEVEGDAEYVVPVTKTEGMFAVNTYTITLTPYPPIDHGLYNGIDTRKLEAMMQKIDWHNDGELFTLREDEEPELTPSVEAIVSRINRLNQDAKGVEISDQLQLKYWTDASFLDGLIAERTWNYLKSLPKRVQQFPVEIKAKTAFNLLCGRAAMNVPAHRPSEEADTWIRLDLGHKEESGNYSLNTIEGFPKKELEDRLDLLPIDNIYFYPIRNALMCGDLLAARLNDGRKVMLQANPEQKTIDIFTPDMRLIPANLTLDPNWRPVTPAIEKVPEISAGKSREPKKSPFAISRKKKHRKGRRM